MKAELLKNNTYRVRKQYKGKSYTVYFDHKPTQKEMIKAMSEKLDAVTHSEANTGTLKHYMDKYVATKKIQVKPRISPATTKTYKAIINNLPSDFLDMNFYDVENKDIQKALDEYKLTRSTKTVKNAFAFVKVVFTSYRPELIINLKYSKPEKKNEYKPTTDDIQRILEYTKGYMFSIPIQLGVLGLRRGEICALQITDLSEDDIITINKDVIIDDENKTVVKEPKTQASYRSIKVPHALAEEIRQQGYIYNGHPNSIIRYFHKVQDELGIPQFRFHQLRAFCVAYLHKHGFSEEQIKAWGGWENTDVMKLIYRYNLDPDEAQEKMADSMAGLF